jgi:hypothetical protein
MKLVDNWKRAWSWFSVHALAILAALPFVWPQIPIEVQAWIPEAWRPWIVAAIAIGGVAGRLIPQSKADG